jgi:YhcH/YjgK/YiaL family protein
MVLDKIENSTMYGQLTERISRAFDYIHSTNLEELKPGKHEVENEDIFAILSEYETKERSECSLEAHRKYIDIQYMLKGSELIGITFQNGQTPTKPYDEADDYELYQEEASYIQLTPGKFAIFFPEDLHMPGLRISGPGQVRKLIMKVRV